MLAKEKGPNRACDSALILFDRSYLPRCSHRRTRIQRSVRIALGDLGDRNRLVVARVSGLAKLRHAQRHNLLHGLACRLQIVARIKLLRSLREHLADCARDGKAIVGVHVDLAHAVADAELNLFDRNAPRLLQLAAVLG